MATHTQKHRQRHRFDNMTTDARHAAVVKNIKKHKTVRYLDIMTIAAPSTNIKLVILCML